MNAKMTSGEARTALLALFREAGRELPELVRYVEKLESDNVRLEEQIKQLKLAAARRAGGAQGMNSRLKDALRE